MSEGENRTYGWMDYQQISLEFATFWDVALAVGM